VPSLGCVSLETNDLPQGEIFNEAIKNKRRRRQTHHKKKHPLPTPKITPPPNSTSDTCTCIPLSYLSCSVLTMSNYTPILKPLEFCSRSEDQNTLFIPVDGDSLKPSARVTRSLAAEYLDYSLDIGFGLTEDGPPPGYEMFRNALMKEKAFEGRTLAIINNGELEVMGSAIHIDELFIPRPVSPPPPLPPSFTPTMSTPSSPFIEPSTATSTVNAKPKKDRNRKRKSKKFSSSAPIQAPPVPQTSISGSLSSVPNILPSAFDANLSSVILDPANIVISTRAAFKNLGIAQRKEEIIRQQIAQRKAKRAAKVTDKTAFVVDTMGDPGAPAPDFGDYEPYTSVLGSSSSETAQAGPSQPVRGGPPFRSRDRGRGRGRGTRYFNASSTHALLGGGTKFDDSSNMDVDFIPMPTRSRTPTKPLKIIPKNGSAPIVEQESEIRMVE
jgi:hypothetical protein